jgi:hypothetical protein
MEDQTPQEESKKLDAEMSKSQVKERAEDVKPIDIVAKDEVESLEKQKKLVDKLMGKFDDWSSWRRPYERVWDEIYRVYFSQTDKSKTPNRSMVTVPIVFQMIEAAVPKVVNVIFSSSEEFFEVVPTDPDETEKAQIIEMLLNYQLSQADFFIKFIDFTKQLLMYGTSYFMTSWKTKRKWVWERTPIRKDLTFAGFTIPRTIGWKEEKVYKVIERRPEVDTIDILDVFPDPDASTEKECNGVFIRSWMNLEDVKEMGAGRFPVFANTESEDLKPDKSQFQASRQVRFSVRGTNAPSTGTSKQVEVLSYWGNLDLDEDGIREECYIVIANRRVLLKASANPFNHQKKPLIRAVMFPVPKEWYGIGLVEPIIPNVHELWTLRRQRLDNINLIINRMWKVNSMADVDLDTLISSPSGIIVTDDMNAVEALETPNVTENAYSEAASIQADIENAMVPKSVQGTPDSGKLGRTARGAQLIVSQALEKFGTAIKLVEEMAIKRVLRMFHQLNLQFLDEDDYFKDPGMYGSIFEKATTPEDIRCECHFKMVAISDMVDKESKINQVISFMGVFGKVLDGQTISTLAKKVWDLMGFNPREVNIQGMAAQPGTQEVIDGNMSQAVLGQVQNQGATAPQAVPGQGANPQ